MDAIARRLGFLSAIIIALLVFLIDIGMIVSTILFPMTSITNIETYANSFTSSQMLPFIPSLMLGPFFVVMVLSLHFLAPDAKKILSQLGVCFSLICAGILSIHYYIQLSIVQQGLLNNELSGLWQFAAPNPHSFFGAFAALGYGFMGIALMCVAPIFTKKSDQSIKWLFIANGIIGIAFLVGNTFGFFAVNIFASLVWGIIFPITSILLAKRYQTRISGDFF
jgi:hypothetical protein